MTDQVVTPAAEAPPAPPPIDTTFSNPREAARASDAREASEAGRKLRAARTAKAAPAAVPTPDTPASAAPVEPAAEPKESETVQAVEDAAPVETQAPGETEVADPAEQPSIEPPRSWTKEAKERWQSLPRDTQEYLAERERARDREVRRGQDEAAEARKAIEAERAKVEQDKQQYEQALPVLMQRLQASHGAEFADIKTVADVRKMAREDWPRYVDWDASQKELAAVQQDMQQRQQTAAQEQAKQWLDFSKKQDELFIERVPEFSDKAKAGQLQEKAVDVLKDIGFTDDELGKLWHGQQGLALRDHRVQLLILDGVRYRDAQAKAKTVQAKPVPPVQRPGVTPTRPNNDADIQALTRALETATGNKAIMLATQLNDARAKAKGR